MSFASLHGTRSHGFEGSDSTRQWGRGARRAPTTVNTCQNSQPRPQTRIKASTLRFMRCEPLNSETLHLATTKPRGWRSGPGGPKVQPFKHDRQDRLSRVWQPLTTNLLPETAFYRTTLASLGPKPAESPREKYTIAVAGCAMRLTWQELASGQCNLSVGTCERASLTLTRLHV